MTSKDFELAREQFRALDNMTYLNWAGTGPMPLDSVRAVKTLVDDLYDYNSPNLMETRNNIPKLAKAELSKLINADPSEIAITGTSTTQGIQTALSAVNPGKGESIVTSDLQYVLTEAEMQKWRNRGVEIRVVKNRSGTFSTEDFSKAIGANTKVVLLDSVTWINGYRFNISEISKLAHESEALMITDSIQHVGHMPLDSRKFGADIIVGSCQKWLSDLLGVGYTFISKSTVESIERPYYGYKNTVEPEGGWPKYFTSAERPLFGDFSFVDSNATKLEYGGSLDNLAGLAALTPSLRLINGIGSGRIYHHIMELKRQLLEGLSALGMEPIPPLEEKDQTGITTFRTGLGSAKDIDIVQKLGTQGVKVSYRAGAGIEGIRVSTHYVNNSDDVDTFVSSLQRLVSEFR